MIAFGMRRKPAAFLGDIEKRTHLILFEADDLFLMKLRRRDLGSVVDLDKPLIKKVLEEGTDC